MPIDAYLVTPTQSDSDNNLLRKIGNALAAVIRGDTGFLVRGTVAVTEPTSPTTATVSGATKTVASAGTPEALGVGTAKEVFIFPLRTNTGVVYWGTSATNDTQNGVLPTVISAPPGKVINLAQIFIDVTVNGEGVRYTTVN